MSDRPLNGIVKEVPSLIKGGWLPTIMLGVVILGGGWLLYEAIVKDKAEERQSIGQIKRDVANIATKQQAFGEACLRVILRRLDPLPSQTIPPGRQRGELP